MPEVKKSSLDLFIVERVKEMRLKHGMSQAVLGVKLDVSDAFIAAIENPTQRAKYNVEHIFKLAQIFNCSPAEFFPKDGIRRN